MAPSQGGEEAVAPETDEPSLDAVARLLGERRQEFLMAATAQSLKRLVKQSNGGPMRHRPPTTKCPSVT